MAWQIRNDEMAGLDGYLPSAGEAFERRNPMLPRRRPLPQGQIDRADEEAFHRLFPPMCYPTPLSKLNVAGEGQKAVHLSRSDLGVLLSALPSTNGAYAPRDYWIGGGSQWW